MIKKYDPLNDGVSALTLEYKTPDMLLSVVNAARVSYGTQKEGTDERDKKLAKFLWDNEHTSPFRHQFMTFRIVAPLFVMRQWWKHQIGATWTEITADGSEVILQGEQIRMDTDLGTSWNETSGRYVQLAPEFYIPTKFRSNAGHANKQASSVSEDWTEADHAEFRARCSAAVTASYEFYQELIANGVAKEISRMFLPQNIYTSVVWTPSLHAVVHFLKLRLKDKAQFEIRQYAEAIYDSIKEELDAVGVTF